jgi:hypothetical protein
VAVGARCARNGAQDERAPTSTGRLSLIARSGSRTEATHMTCATDCDASCAFCQESDVIANNVTAMQHERANKMHAGLSGRADAVVAAMQLVRCGRVVA